MDLFFTGMHQPSNATAVPAAFISINRLRGAKGRKTPFLAPDQGWGLDSGAFTTVNKHGGYPDDPVTYALEADYWVRGVPNCRFVVAQDYMCEPFVLQRTGLTVADHQRLTIERYDQLRAAWETLGNSGVPILPVLQGYDPQEYVEHLRAYGDRFAPGAWVGVGSVCKRNGSPSAIVAVLSAIKAERPDLRLHGFGVKTTSLAHQAVRDLLYSADSMAWSFAARREGRSPNSPVEAAGFDEKIRRLCKL